MAPADGPSPTPRLLSFLVVAVLLGLAAATLLAPGSTSQGVTIAPGLHAPAAPPWLGIALILGFIGATIGIPLFSGLGASNASRFYAALFITCILVGAAVAEVFRILNRPGVPGNNTTVHSNATASCATDPRLCPLGTPGGPSAPVIATWYDGALLYAVIIVAVLVAAVLIPRVLEIRTRRRGERAYLGTPTPTEGLQIALASLSESAVGDDARRRIIRAYGELLRNVGSRLPNLETATPREIAEEVQRRFRIRAATAQEMTGLFEEARYSKGRPMAPDAVERAEAALRRALEEAAPEGEALP